MRAWPIISTRTRTQAELQWRCEATLNMIEGSACLRGTGLPSVGRTSRKIPVELPGLPAHPRCGIHVEQAVADAIDLVWAPTTAATAGSASEECSVATDEQQLTVHVESYRLCQPRASPISLGVCLLPRTLARSIGRRLALRCVWN